MRVGAQCRIMNKRISKSRLNRHGILSTNAYNVVYIYCIIKNSFAESFKETVLSQTVLLKIWDEKEQKQLIYNLAFIQQTFVELLVCASHRGLCRDLKPKLPWLVLNTSPGIPSFRCPLLTVSIWFNLSGKTKSCQSWIQETLLSLFMDYKIQFGTINILASTVHQILGPPQWASWVLSLQDLASHP